VEAVIKELNYRPNQSARGLAARRSYMIGLLYDSPSPNYLANLQAGMIEACHRNHYGLALNPVSYHADDMVDSVLHWVRQAFVDCVLLTPPLTDSPELVAALEEAGIPCLNISSEGTGSVPAVLIDEEGAAYRMTRHLLDSGHTRIGFIKGHPDHFATRKRWAGFEAAMTEAGLAVDDQLVGQGYFDFETGLEAASALLSLDEPPTAIFACNDDMAAAAIYEAHSRKLEVPGDLAVAGFDDTPLSRQVWPGLTTVRQPIRSMGRQAAQLLIDAMTPEGREALAEQGRIQIDFELQLRGSTARG
jgi:LacI family transcriptional regulator